MSERVINFSLKFKADTESAKKQVEQLQRTLDQTIGNSSKKQGLNITPSIERATHHAMQLKSALQQATNVDTGKLNLNKFTSSLRLAGLDIKTLAKDLKALGPSGEKAFKEMADAMASADRSVISLQGGMRRLVNTFANTLRYQASAKAIQLMTSSITDAISYTKELDKTLTGIQMVTGESVENMRKLAVQANKTAKSLSTTTNEYLKASHIYFQQGLDTNEAMKRANITIKLAHATGDSMEEVSNWMTAIWNNFDNGTKSLEYYSDVLARLGAETASSADEIATGLEKFAAVAETVGLSYEYAASALATITAETRQSAEVVGTALKTLFSRMESLKLGETLDDGTTLNQYSLALQSVGVNIKDTNGELKDMDQILDETALKWEILSKDQKVALAQSVAGVRQYTQFIALMDNYDIMQNNIQMAKESAGSLEKMQEDYANSIQGLQDKSRASMEKLFSELMDDEDIKKFYKSLTKITDFFAKLVDSAGGLKGILLLLSSTITKMYQPKIADMFQRMAFSAKDLYTNTTNAAKGFLNVFRSKDNQLTLKNTYSRQQEIEAAALSRRMTASKADGEGVARIDEKIYEIEMRRISAGKNLSQMQQDQLSWQIERLKLLREEAKAEGANIAELRKKQQVQMDLLNATKDPAKIEAAKKTLQANTTMRVPTETTYSAKGYMGGEKQQVAADKLIADLNASKEAAELLGINITDLGFDQALAGAQAFKNGFTEHLDALRIKIQELRKALKQAAEAPNEEQPSSGTLKRDIDEDYIATRGAAIGRLDAKSQKLGEVAGQLKGADSSSQGAAIGTMRQALVETKQAAERLGISIEGIDGFNELSKDVENFKIGSSENIEEIIKKVEKLQQQLQQAANDQAKLTGENAIRAAVEGEGGKQGAFNDLSNIGLHSSSVETQSETATKAFTTITSGDKTPEEKKSEKRKKADKAAERLSKKKEERAEKKQAKEKKKTEAATIKSVKERRKAEEKAEKEYLEALAQIEEEEKEQIKIIQEWAREEEKTYQSGQDNMKGYEQALDENGEAVQDAITASRDLERAETQSKDGFNELSQSVDDYTDKILEANKPSLSNMFGGILSGAMSAASGFQLLTSGVESFTAALQDDNATIGDYISSLMTMIPGLAQVYSGVLKVCTSIGAEIAARKMAKQASAQETAQKVKDSGIKMGANIAEGTTGVAKNIAGGYATWPAAIAGIAALAAVGAAVAFSIPKAPSKEEKEQAAIEADNAALDRMNERLTESKTNLQEVKDLLSSYDEVSSTFDKLVEGTEAWNENLQKQQEILAQLIEQYPELATNGMLAYVNGIYTIAEGKEDELRQYAQGKATTEMLMAQMGQANAAAKARASKEELNYQQKLEDLDIFDKDFLKKYQDIIEEHEQNLEKINKQNAAQWMIVAQSITSNLQGFSQMTDLQQQASTTLVKEQLERIYGRMALDDFQVGYGLEFAEGAYGGGGAAEYGQFIKELQEVVGTDKSGWSMFEDTAWNMEHSELGQAALAKYTKEVLGQDIASMGSKEFHAERVDIGKDTTIYFNDVLQYYADQLANSRLDLQKAFEDVKSMPDEIAAGISLNYLSLSEEQMSAIATEQADGSWTLNEDYKDRMLKALEEQGIVGEEATKYLNEMVEQAKNYNAELAETLRLQADLQKGNAYIAQESEKYGLEAETLERYAKSLQKSGKISYEAAAKMAVANAKMSKGVEGLRDKLEDVIDTLKNYDTTSYEFAEAAAEISESLSLMFGADVSNELIKKWADDGSLQKLAAGGKEAVEIFEKLRLDVGEEFILSLSIDDSYKEEFTDLLDQLNQIAQQKGVGATFDLNNNDAIASLNELLAANKITVDQVEQMFNSIGWAPDITYKTVPTPPSYQMMGQKDELSYDDAMDYVNGTKTFEGSSLNYSVIETRGQQTIPVIGDAESKITYTGTPGISSLSKKSSGSGSKSKKKDKNQEIERYHEITQKLEDLNREYDKLGKLKDRAFGQSHLDYLDLESKKLDEVIEGEKEYIRQIEEKLALDKEALAKYGVSFDGSGRITNYDEVYAAQIDQYNTNPEAYEESYNKFTEEMSQYEDSLNLLEDKEEELFDKQNERFDKSLEKAEYVVEYGTSLVEDSLSIIEYQLEKIEDKAYSTAEALALMGQKMNEVSKKSDIYKEGIEATLAASGLSIDDILGASPEELAELVANGTFTAEQVEQLRNYRDELLNTNQEMKDMANETLDKLLEGFDEWNEAIDKNKEKIDHLKEVTNSYRDIIDLIGKDNLGVSNQMLKQMNEFNIAASQSQVDITRRQLEENKRSLEKAREEYRNAASEEEKYYWGQVVESLEETVMQGESDLLSATQDSLDIIQEAFSDALTNITKEFEKAISGMYGSLEALQAAYDQRTDKRERYLEDYAKIYELSKLTRDINKSMDESDSIRGKQRLLEIQEEINALQESGVEMTQFEVDELRARYDLRLAEIALEEAQNAKSQVRMTRDSEGNWSYAYTADQDAIDNAQQNYEDKLYAYQNLTTEYIYNLESQIMEIPSQLSEALQAIWEDTTLTDEEKEARAQEAIDFYIQKDAFLKEQMEKAIGCSKELYDKDWKNYSNATGYKISADEEWIKSFDGTVLSQITGFKTLEEYQQAFAGSAMTMANDMRTAYQTMTSNIDKTLQNMGTSMTTFAQDLQGLMNTNKQKIEEYTKEVDDDIEKMGTSSAEAMKKAADNWALYADYVANSAGANEDLATALNNVIAAIGSVGAPLDDLSRKYEELERDARAAAAAIASVGSGTVPSYEPPKTPDTAPITIDNDPSGVVWYGGIMDISLSNPALSGEDEPIMTQARYRTLEFKNVKANTYQVSSGGTVLGYVDNAGMKKLKRLKESSQSYIDTKMEQIGLPSGFDTGGYTGSWDSSGRLAMLHQKELVLNAKDTENFLAAVNIVRELSAAIDLKALAYQNALGQMSGAIRMSHEPQRLQQDVTIHAEFPNVTERNEIEAAFNSLMNQATQYVHRK